MKLSELKGERAVIVIADLIEPIANIASDQKNLQLFKNERREGESDADVGVREIKEKLPKLLKTHKKDVLDILCTINDCEPEDMSTLDIVKGVIDLVNDKEFLGLFLSSGSAEEKKPRTESSADAGISEPEH